jgi:hypothetical protein
MNSEAQVSFRNRCRQLKKRGLTVQQIANKLHRPHSTVGYHVKGISNRTPRQTAAASIIGQTRIGQRKDAIRALDNAYPISKISNDLGVISNVGQGKKNIGQSEKSVGQSEKNIGQNPISNVLSHPISKNNGGYIVVGFVIILLVIFLLDHFLFEGRFLAYIRSYFSEEEETETPSENVPESRGFEGRSIEDI